MIEAMHSKVLRPPRFRYSQVVKAGGHYYCSGMLAMNNQTGELMDADSGEQARIILHNASLLMDELGLSWENLVIARIYAVEMNKFVDINAIWDQVFKQTESLPARTAIGVSALPLGALVEMEFIFYQG